jgi:hypothetical protein
MFRSTIALYLPRYLALPTRKERQGLIALILQEIVSDGGRFLERQGNCWVTLRKAQAHRKVGHALRDAALRRTSKNEKTTMDKIAWEDRPNQDPKMEQFDSFDEEVSWISLGLDENTENDQQRTLQNDALDVFEELKVPRSPAPDWTTQLDSYVKELTMVDFDCGSLISYRDGEVDNADQNDFLFEMPI